MRGSSATPNKYPYQNEPGWSKSEKMIARKAFDAALGRELQEVMQKAKRMADQIKDPAGLWKLEAYLTKRRQEIDRKYDHRSSRLTLVFGILLSEGRVTEEDLSGLREDKMDAIRSYAKIRRGHAA